jgi:uncharacterized protein YndB with AHSA1/START domain
MTESLRFEYVTYVCSTRERVWHALTAPDATAEYWGHSNVSDWTVGSNWKHLRTDGSAIADVQGVVLESTPPARLVVTWAEPGDEPVGGPTRVTFEIESYREIVRLILVHENLADEAARADPAAGWSAVLSNLKTTLETGYPLPQEPWQMPAVAA